MADVRDLAMSTEVLLMSNVVDLGSEGDVVVSFEDADGHVARAGTKRLNIPQYSR